MAKTHLLAACLAASLSACSLTSTLNLASGGGATREARNIPYGSLDRQTYDLYPAEDPSAPVVVFVYGGSWQRGEKSQYAFVANELNDQGFTVVVPDYRLFPAVRFPLFVRDVAKAVAKARREVAGGRPVLLMGHSAGAEIAALVAYDPSYLRAEGLEVCRSVSGFVGLAGPYDFLPLTDPNLRQVFPPAVRARSQPIAYATGPAPPSLLLHGTDDDLVEPDNTTRMAAALKRAGNRVEGGILSDVNHYDIIGAFGPLLSKLAPVREPVMRFLQARAGRRGC